VPHTTGIANLCHVCVACARVQHHVYALISLCPQFAVHSFNLYTVFVVTKLITRALLVLLFICMLCNGLNVAEKKWNGLFIFRVHGGMH